MNKRSEKTLRLVQLSLFSGIIVIMAFTPFIGYIPLGFTRATIIHIPVILGSLMMGPRYGAILGGVFGLTSLINNTINPTATSFVFSPFISIGDLHGGFYSLIICFVPRILIGVVPYYIFKLITARQENPTRSRLIAGFATAGVAGSLTNTLLVMNMIFFFFRESYAQANEVPIATLYSFILGIIGINGVPEAIVAAIIISTIGIAFNKTKYRIR